LRGYALALSGRPEEGCTILAGGLEEAVRLRFLPRPLAVGGLPRAQLVAGQMDEARRRAAEALRLSRERGQRGYEALALFVQGQIESQPGVTATPEAAGPYRQGWSSPTSSVCVPSQRPATSASRNSTCRRTSEQAQEHLPTAAAMYRSMGMRFWLERVEGEVRSLR
jgi:ATP/maltotriose-dependent transcriptional regulator MalT